MTAIAPTPPGQASPSCSPRWTSPSTDRPNDLARFQRLATILRQPLAPWQRHAGALFTEHRPDGRYAYNRCVLIVPRRAGKTFLLLLGALSIMLDRRRRAFYASHRRETAAALWRDEHFPMLDESPLERYLDLRRANGSESITLRETGSTYRILPADGDAARSFRSNLAHLDEARELTEDQGADLEAGIFPTQATGVGGQTWIVSNAGTVQSAWLKKWRDIGRAAALEGRTDRTAFIEYSADPDADRDDPATWIGCHPGLSHHVNLDTLEADHESMSPTDFATEYLGLWADVLIDSDLLDAWNAHVAPRATPNTPLAFALEVSEDRTRSVIVAAGAERPDGTGTVVELVEDRPHDGGQWIPARLAELAEKWEPVAITYDNRGPAAALAIDLANVPANVAGLRTEAVIAAAGQFHDRTMSGRIIHRDDPTMAAAVAALRRRTAGGAWCFDRREPDALPAIAATLAAYAHRTNLAPNAY
jgi:phage terminase large subunit-like protein